MNYTPQFLFANFVLRWNRMLRVKKKLTAVRNTKPNSFINPTARGELESDPFAIRLQNFQPGPAKDY
jgi:hypothetical protein